MTEKMIITAVYFFSLVFNYVYFRTYFLKPKKAVGEIRNEDYFMVLMAMVIPIGNNFATIYAFFRIADKLLDMVIDSVDKMNKKSELENVL